MGVISAYSILHPTDWGYDSPKAQKWKLAIRTIVSCHFKTQQPTARMKQPGKLYTYQQNHHVLGYIPLGWKCLDFTYNFSYTLVNIEV